MATLGAEESGCCGEVAIVWGGGVGVSYDKFFLGGTTCLLCYFLLVVSHNVKPIINNIQRDKIHTQKT